MVYEHSRPSLSHVIRLGTMYSNILKLLFHDEQSVYHLFYIVHLKADDLKTDFSSFLISHNVLNDAKFSLIIFCYN